MYVLILCKICKTCKTIKYILIINIAYILIFIAYHKIFGLTFGLTFSQMSYMIYLRFPIIVNIYIFSKT